ncbi:MAG: hypothetical protein COC24_008105 [Alphaproteobacteria bacterium]|nr:hypothetical protein [Alphaproteobacteria bacterium]
MQENEQIIPVKKPPTWLYVIIWGMGIGIIGMIAAIGYGLIVGFGDKKLSTRSSGGETMVAIPEGKKFPDFNIKLKPSQKIEQVEYEAFRIMVFVRDETNQENLIIVLSATNGNEVGRFILGE